VTKKDYVRLAEIVSKRLDDAKGRGMRSGREEAVKAITQFALDLCDLFVLDNPRFDKARFLKACGL
jgi:hypothetical protein